MAISRTQKKQLDSQLFSLVNIDSAKHKSPSTTYSFTPKHTKRSEVSNVSNKTSKFSSTNITSDVQTILGYDISLIVGDLRMTLIVTLLLVGILIGLAWYFPFGVLSA